jgi:hypothetical protein
LPKLSSPTPFRKADLTGADAQTDNACSAGRRDCLGAVVQIDGSEHAVDRAEKCALLPFVDDATSRLMRLRFMALLQTFRYGT